MKKYFRRNLAECYFPEIIKNFDIDGYRVVELVEELSINSNFETKNFFI